MIGDILLDLARETAGGIAKLGVTAGATKLDVTEEINGSRLSGLLSPRSAASIF